MFGDVGGWTGEGPGAETALSQRLHPVTCEPAYGRHDHEAERTHSQGTKRNNLSDSLGGTV